MLRKGLNCLILNNQIRKVHFCKLEKSIKSGVKQVIETCFWGEYILESKKSRGIFRLVFRGFRAINN